MAEYFRKRSAHRQVPIQAASDEAAPDEELGMFAIVQHLMLPCPRSDFNPSPWNQTAGPVSEPPPYDRGPCPTMPCEDATQRHRAGEDLCCAPSEEDLSCVPSNGDYGTTSHAAVEPYVIVTDPEFVTFSDDGNLREPQSHPIGVYCSLTDDYAEHSLIDAVLSHEKRASFPEQIEFETDDPAQAFFTLATTAM